MMNNFPYAEKVDCRYGSPMGRSNIVTPPTGKVKLRRVPMNSGGEYDSGGAYWGAALNEDYLWCGWHSQGRVFVRAYNREAAKSKILITWPNAKFFR